MKVKNLFCCLLAAAMMAGSVGATAVSVSADTSYESFYSQSESEIAIFSDEYKSTDFYSKLQTALEENKDVSLMEKTLAIALSQEGYKNYATSGIDIDEARANGLLWTGAVKRMNEEKTGNTEYTRWAQRYIMNGDEQYQYADLDWCAIFVSWCLFNGGYYSDEQLKKYYYSYCSDPRIEFDADSWITAFNMDQEKVWYTSLAERKIAAYSSWNHFVHTDIDPYEIPYKPGGLLFFSMDGSGNYFDHVAIVVDYDPDTHELTYINGNNDGQVSERRVNLDEETIVTDLHKKNSEIIMAYAEYDTVAVPEQKIITADQERISWDVNSSQGITVETNSESVIVSVSENGNYFGSNIENNMLLRYGVLSIGKSEMLKLGLGTHHLLLTFDDGTLELVVTCYDSETELTADNTDFTWDRSSDEGITIRTNSLSETVGLFIDGMILGTEETEGVDFVNGELVLSRKFLNSNLEYGDNNVSLVFADGQLEIKIEVTSEKKEITADNTDFIWDRNSDEGITIRTNSESETVRIRIGGGTAGTEYTDGVYYENGELTLDKEFLDEYLEDGDNSVRLIFTDGELEITIHVTDIKGETELKADNTDFTWDRNSDEGITIRTNSESETVGIRIGGGTVGTEETEGVYYENGELTLSKDFLNSVLEDGDNSVRLIFTDGELEITIHVTDKKEETETSDVETSDVETSDVETSDVETSDVETSDVETSDVETSDVETSDLGTSDVETSDVKTSDVKTSDKETPVKETSVKDTTVKIQSEVTTETKTNAVNTPQTGDTASAAAALFTALISGIAGLALIKKKES